MDCNVFSSFFQSFTVSQNCHLAWVSEWQIWAQKDGESGKFGGKYRMNWVQVENCGGCSELWLWWQCYDSH